MCVLGCVHACIHVCVGGWVRCAMMYENGMFDSCLLKLELLDTRIRGLTTNGAAAADEDKHFPLFLFVSTHTHIEASINKLA